MDRPPPERLETLRQALHQALRAGNLTLRELSQQLGAAERELLPHLEHLERSLQHGAERLAIEPAHCIACGFAFEDRTRIAKPGRCPACKATRIAPPRFAIMPA
jgi:transcriptional regulator